jgi:hypothetical protein
MDRNEKRYAVLVCLFIVLALGISGWYQNHEPIPQPDVGQVMRLCDQEVARNVGVVGR